MHKLVFYVKQRNADILSERLKEISDPKHPSYGKHMTKEQVNELTANKEAEEDILKYLKTNSEIKGEHRIIT